MSNVVLKPIPELTETNPAARLVEFYAKLGWNMEDQLDPTRVRMWRDDLNALVAAETEHAKRVLTDPGSNPVLLVGFLWASKGPSADGVTPGKVELHPGWTIPVTKKQEVSA